MKTFIKCLLVLVAAYALLVVVGMTGAGIGTPELLIVLVLAIAAMVVIVRRDKRTTI
jgi:hypothetical protein